MNSDSAMKLKYFLVFTLFPCPSLENASPMPESREDFSDILKIIGYLVVSFVIEVEEISKTAKHQGNYFNCFTSF